MRQITINFTAQTVVSSFELGRIGEHNATELTITPPTSLSGDERTAMYRIAFYTGSETILTESYTDTPIVIDLWQQLTQHARLSLQVIAYDTDGEFIGKSPKLAGFYFAPSVETSDVADISDAPDVTAEIGANTAARHTHDNKAILDAITNPPHSEITTVGHPNKSQYTPAELGQFYADRVVLTYGGLPVSSGNYDVMADTFTFSYQYVNHSDKTEIVCPTCTVASNKNITILNTYTVPKTINGKSAGGTTGAVTLNAGDITAASGWSPSADEDLATKKYVDENSGGQTYEIVASEYTPDTSPYTGAELWALFQAGERITYNHIPISFGYSSGNAFVFSTFEYDINGNPGYRALNTVNASRQIGVKTFKQFVKQINGATVSTAGYVTIKADNIQASANWTPSDDKDLATKKYVDDNAGGTPDWSDIQNKPNFATVATSGSYNDLLNQPTIPDISGCEVTSNKVTAIDNTSTDTQYPSAKCVYDGLALKQDTLTAGTNITIDSDNVISATGGGSLPSGTADGDILVWDNTAQEWTVRSGWQILYQPVEYIESTGTQYINTGVLPQANMRVIVDTQYSATPSSSESYIGGSTNATWAFVWASEGASGQWATIVNNSYTWAKFGTIDTNRHTWDLQSGSQKFDGTVVSTTNFTQNITNVSFTMLHFARHTNSATPNGWSKEKLYSLKYYYGDTLIRDFIPCYNRITNEIGLFDIVENKFYANAGTGTFTKGADV